MERFGRSWMGGKWAGISRLIRVTIFLVGLTGTSDGGPDIKKKKARAESRDAGRRLFFSGRRIAFGLRPPVSPKKTHWSSSGSRGGFGSGLFHCRRSRSRSECFQQPGRRERSIEPCSPLPPSTKRPARSTVCCSPFPPRALLMTANHITFSGTSYVRVSTNSMN